MIYYVNCEVEQSPSLSTLEEAEEVFEGWKNDKMAEGVSLTDSFVEIWCAQSDSDEDMDNAQLIKRVVVEVDEEQHRDLGEPKEHGMDFAFWAKWSEVTK